MTHHSYSTCEELDATFFSGDEFNNPEALAEIEWYVQRWTRQIEAIKKHRFYGEPHEHPSLMKRYEAHVAHIARVGVNGPLY